MQNMGAINHDQKSFELQINKMNYTRYQKKQRGERKQWEETPHLCLAASLQPQLDSWPWAVTPCTPASVVAWGTVAGLRSCILSQGCGLHGKWGRLGWGWNFGIIFLFKVDPVYSSLSSLASWWLPWFFLLSEYISVSLTEKVLFEYPCSPLSTHSCRFLSAFDCWPFLLNCFGS